MKSLSQHILNILRQMDNEADTAINGVHAGLAAYAKHAGSKHHKRSISADIAQHLSDSGFPTETEVPYPDGHQTRCDLVTTLPNGESCWIETKIIWWAWYSASQKAVRRNDKGIYRGYLFGPLEQGLERSHSVAQDVDKLEALTSPAANSVAVVLIGFDEASGPVVNDVHWLIELKQLRSRGWQITGPQTWADQNSDQCRLCCWVWWREVGE